MFFSLNVTLYSIKPTQMMQDLRPEADRLSRSILADGSLHDKTATKTLNEVTLVTEHATTNKRLYF